MMRLPSLTLLPSALAQSLGRKVRWRLAVLWVAVGMVTALGIQPPALASQVDPYVLRYLDASQPIELQVDAVGTATRTFSALDLSEGKRFFEENCVNCHVGGATLPNPSEPLSLEALRGAMPPRDTLEGLVAFMRQPMAYDGQEESYWCRAVPETWLEDAEVENVAAFILRASQKAPGWGSREF